MWGVVFCFTLADALEGPRIFRPCEGLLSILIFLLVFFTGCD